MTPVIVAATGGQSVACGDVEMSSLPVANRPTRVRPVTGPEASSVRGTCRGTRGHVHEHVGKRFVVLPRVGMCGTLASGVGPSQKTG
ncbi:unnamed protein product [Protopolystoma xenopodis]|uniref:Uncharacterized protein n=1 Tax=Protopolystoma xenopodis TaxID=117903 RepID=A0A3S4ZSS4_9PLAT|nr:unnamed protein product [Protopolystoma xenopodis]